MSTNLGTADPQQRTTAAVPTMTMTTAAVNVVVVPSMEGRPRREIQQQQQQQHHPYSSSSSGVERQNKDDHELLPRPTTTTTATPPPPGAGKPPRSERKPRHKKSAKSAANNQQDAAPQEQLTSPSTRILAPEDRPDGPPGKKASRKQLQRQLRHEQQTASSARTPTEVLLQMAQRLAALTPGLVQIVGSEGRGEPLAGDSSAELDSMKKIDRPGRLQIVTTCQSQLPVLEEGRQAILMDNVNVSTTSAVATTRIYIKPLLILDLNGILCHRIRQRHWCRNVENNNSLSGTTTTATTATAAAAIDKVADLPLSTFRNTVGPVIAQTPIVARPNVEEWLTYMDRYFCLAVWTSGKKKTARALVQALVPPKIAQRFLFVWAQHHCRAELPKQQSSWSGNSSVSSSCSGVGGESSSEPVKIHPSEIIYKKDLGQVWQEYPLWNASNTLLIDDSPDKCVAWRENAVHPPRLNGLRQRRDLLAKEDLDIATTTSSTSSNNGQDITEDDLNVAQQQVFFEQLVQHWTEHPLVEEWDTEAQDAVLKQGGDRLLTFLRKHAVGHMGWTEPTSATTTTLLKEYPQVWH